MKPNPLDSGLLEELVDWYWKHGSRRTGNYELSRSGFLSPLCGIAERFASIPDVDGRKRAVIGLWGPSQVGKSTLLSSFLDLGADGMGRGSILQWSDSEPVRFERSQSHPDDRPLSLNPYNFKADASACISRFTMVADVPDPEYPVEIRLAKPSQLLHALALGYLYDWHREEGAGLKSASRILEDRIAKSGQARAASRDGFKLAHAAAATMRVLRNSKLEHARFQALTEELIDRFLDSAAAVEPREGVLKTLCEIFWDNEKDISNVFSEILKIIEFYEESCRRMFCSYEVASLIVDMQSHLRAEGGTTFDGDRIPADDALLKRILSIGRRTDNAGNIYLGVGGGDAAFEELVEYAVFQAAVWELLIPVNAGRLENLAADGITDAKSFVELLKQVDVLDFPGVSNIGRGGGDRINSSIINRRGHHLLFSHLVKRGKTSAMVSASADRSHVDGFCVLMRAQGAFANPGIINDGLHTWRESFAGSGDPFVNVVVTFFGELIQDAIRNPEKSTFKGAFNSLEALSPELFRGDNVFSICFHKYENLIPDGFWASGELTPEIETLVSNVERAASRLAGDPDFARLFGSDPDEVADTALVQEGGLSKVVDRLIFQGGGVNKPRYYESLLGTLNESLGRLLEMALPGETSEIERKKHLLEKITRDLGTMIYSGNGSYSTGKAREISAALRRLLGIREGDLDAVPLRVARDPERGRTYLREQLEKWREQNSCQHPELGIRNAADAANLCSYLASAVPIDEALEWLVENFGTIARPSAAQDACRYLAVKLTELLMPRGLGVERDGERESPEDVIKKISRAEHSRQVDSGVCPHYLSVIGPFLRRLDDVAGRSVGERPPQDGDNELLAIIDPNTKEEMAS